MGGARAWRSPAGCVPLARADTRDRDEVARAAALEADVTAALALLEDRVLLERWVWGEGAGEKIQRGKIYGWLL